MKLLTTILFLLTTFFCLAQSANWNEYKLKEHWKRNGADEIEGIYIRARKVVNCNGFGNCKTNNFVSEANFYIVKQNGVYIMSSFTNDIFGSIIKVYGSNKFFLSTNLKYWVKGEDEDKTYSMYFSNSNELILENILYEQDYASATISDKFYLVYKP